MFTRQELNIMRSALRYWDGPYGKGATLNNKESDRVMIELDTAEKLALRFEGILQDYYEIENR